MAIVAIGTSHSTASIDIREKIAFSEKDIEKAYKILLSTEGIEECVILSTCNRTEIYASVKDGLNGVELLLEFLAEFHSLDKSINNYCYSYEEFKAVEHLYNVAGGLDSMVMGEDQILGQVKNAHQKAMDSGASGTVMNTLFRYAITAAKKIKAQTKISETPLSISSIAVKFIKNRFGDIRDKKFFVLGIGKMSTLAIMNLVSEGVKDIYIANRSQHKAVEVKEKLPGVNIIPFEDRMEFLSSCDVVISSTSAPHYILKKENFVSCFNSSRPICFVDLSLPRDIDPEIGKLENVTLYSLDDLKLVSTENMEKRILESVKAKSMIHEELISFREWYMCRQVTDAIKDMQKYYNTILDEEVGQLPKRLQHLKKEDVECIESILRSMAKKMFMKPILNIKKAACEGKGQICSEILLDLFDLNEKEG